MYATVGLVDALLGMADDRDPNPVTVTLATRPASELASTDEGAGIDDGSGHTPNPDDPVFTDFYFPETGGSVRAVFGMDLGTPNAAGRFVSHPTGPLAVTREDDLHETVLVAVPPYDRESLAAFDRRGARRDLHLLDAAPPEVAFEG